MPADKRISHCIHDSEPVFDENSFEAHFFVAITQVLLVPQDLTQFLEWVEDVINMINLTSFS